MRPWLLATFLVVFAVACGGLGPSVATSARASRCDRPLTYSVVRVNPGHHVSTAAFVALLRRSERLWESPTGKDLFRYEVGGEVHVSLIYDYRQALENAIAAEDRSIAQMRAGLAQQRADIRAEGAKLEARQAAQSAKVKYWNSRGGAPHDQFVLLEAENAALDDLVTAFNGNVRAENVSIARFNAAVTARNALVRKRRSGELQLGKAQLGGTEVSIFVLNRTARDEALVAHEFGHILGLEHIPGAGNIMNATSVKTLGRVSAADLEALRKVCGSR